ncbi:MAG: GNAT family N-acetyltransferase [Candidatus Acidiferrales bacterium]
MKLKAIASPAEIQLADLMALYANEWWTDKRTAEDVRRMLAHTDFVFGFTEEPTGKLVAFARVLTDRVYKALVLDVIVAPAHRGTGLGRKLMEALLAHPELQAVRHWELYCKPEMMPLYRKWGFTSELGGVNFMRMTRGQEIRET